MRDLGTRLGHGVLAGVTGLVAMEIVRRATAPIVKQRTPKPTEVFRSERSMSPLGPHHLPDEGATAALARIGYQQIAGKPPSERTKSTLSWAVHISYGLAVAALYGALRGDSRHALRDGALFAAALWVFGDELAVPLLGLTDKPTTYHPTQHLQSLAQHLAFGMCAATATRLLEEVR